MADKNEYLSQEGYDLMGAAFEVYNEMGHGLSEEIYQECLEVELADLKIPFHAQIHLDVWFKNKKITKTYIPDLLVYGEILAELKAVKELTADHEKQLLNYLHITKKAVGYLINFGCPKKLEWKRFILSEYIPK
jgi:GxxExxY protein